MQKKLTRRLLLQAASLAGATAALPRVAMAAAPPASATTPELIAAAR